MSAVVAQLAADPVVAGRDRLLDPTWVALHLPGLFGQQNGEDAQDIEHIELLRAKYRIGESLRVVYRYQSDGAVETISARTFAGGRSVEVAAAAVASDESSDPPGVAHQPEVDAVWFRLPRDRKLRGLDALLYPSVETAGTMSLRGWTRSTIAEYAPERSITLAALDERGTPMAFVKAYTPGSVDVAALAERYERLASHLAGQPGVRSPRVIHVDASRSVLALEAVPGSPWSGAGGVGIDGLFALGRAFASVHDLRVDEFERAAMGLRDFSRLAPPRLHRSAELVATARPDVAAAVADLGERLAASRPGSETDDDVFLHGDCHPANALCGVDGVALIDFDQAGIGSAALDLGSFAARLRYGGLVGEYSATEAAAFERAALDGYASIRPLPEHDVLAWHIAAALLAERAMRSVNRVNPVGLAHLGDVIELAHLTLRGVPA